MVTVHPTKSALIGVLALQGAFREHSRMLRALGAEVREIRLPGQLENLDGLVIPGGESTTMGKLMESYGLTEPLRRFAGEHPVLGTCAGLIMLSQRTSEGSQPLLGLLDVTVKRNAFGRQLRSFEGQVRLRLPGRPAESYPGVFIRSPWVEQAGEGVEVIAMYEDRIVGVRQGKLVGVAFHPELTDDNRLHRYFLQSVAEARAGSAVETEVA